MTTHRFDGFRKGPPRVSGRVRDICPLLGGQKCPTAQTYLVPACPTVCPASDLRCPVFTFLVPQKWDKLLVPLFRKVVPSVTPVTTTFSRPTNDFPDPHVHACTPTPCQHANPSSLYQSHASTPPPPPSAPHPTAHPTRPTCPPTL